MENKIYTQKLDIEHRYALIQPCYVHQNLSQVQDFSQIGLLDTGATRTTIGQGIVDQLGLVSNEFSITYGVSGESYSKIYRGLRVRLPNYPEGFLVDALCSGSYYGIQMPFNLIIGMDIIKRGDFTINSETKSFSLDFSKTKL